MNNNVKLHLGCGNVIIQGFINVDVLPSIKGVELVCDLNNLSLFKDEQADFIYICHVLEHFSTTEVPKIINEFSRILRPGGRLRISVPDLNKICSLYVKNIDWFYPPNNPWIGLLWGGQKDIYDYHKTGFNYPYLEWLLTKTNFTDVKEVYSNDDLGIVDASQNRLPFGEISLNVEAIKSGAKRYNSEKHFEYSAVEKAINKLTIALEKILSALVRIKILLIKKRMKKHAEHNKR
jgi:predicted SAM-dependent methyltransferase